MTPYQVVWKGPVHRLSGLGIASNSYVHALRRLGVKVQADDSGPAAPRSGSSPMKRVLICHQLPHKFNFRQARKRYDAILLNTVWETSRIPRRWLPLINQFDAVCVPSAQNERALRSSGVKIPIFRVPHGVDTAQFKPDNPKLPLRNMGGRFVFISVFGFQHRKNPETLLRAYWEEFSAADSVLLIIKTNGYAPYETQAWIRQKIRQYKERLGIRKPTAPVLVLSGQLTPSQLKGIYTRGQAFVLPTRGEGVGLPFLESLASGTPVIATGWGGHMDFLNGKNAFLIPYRLKPPAVSMDSGHSISRTFRHLFVEEGQLWAEPDRPALRRLMRTAYRNPLLCKKKGRQGRQDVRKLSWNRAGISLKTAIEKALRSKR
ncbi:glycosyltransferase [Paenibacillus puerhi]|uniref:glycosyltransferase n=1 Tax=Paenibacillus puerhi TaxID=2692622 RepID=UPI00135B77D9|nr:glycosyltransferase [Paenibacillus puerhi]